MLAKALNWKIMGVLAVLAIAAFMSVWLLQTDVVAQEPGPQSVTEAAETGNSDINLPAEDPPPLEAPTASLTFFTDRATFDAAAPGLPVEDFEEGNIGAGRARGCPRPIDENTTNQCFSTGDILPGLSITSVGPSRRGVEMFLTGPGFAGTTTKGVGVNFFVDAIAVDFTGGDVTAVGMKLFTVFGSDFNLRVDIFGANGLLGSTTAVGTPSGRFWGVKSDTVITRVRIKSFLNKAEGVDDIAFGGVSDPHEAIENAIAKLEGKADTLERKADASAQAIADAIAQAKANAQAIANLERKADKAEGKLDKIEEKLDALAASVSSIPSHPSNNQGNPQRPSR